MPCCIDLTLLSASRGSPIRLEVYQWASNSIKKVDTATDNYEGSFENENDELVEEMKMSPVGCVDAAGKKTLTEDKDRKQKWPNPDWCPAHGDTSGRARGGEE